MLRTFSIGNWLVVFEIKEELISIKYNILFQFRSMFYTQMRKKITLYRFFNIIKLCKFCRVQIVYNLHKKGRLNPYILISMSHLSLASVLDTDLPPCNMQRGSLSIENDRFWPIFQKNLYQKFLVAQNCIKKDLGRYFLILT